MEERMEKEAGRAGAAEQTSAGKALVQADEHRIFMRKNYAFFGGASALYALFYTFCLYRNASGITWPFSRQEPLFIFTHVPEGQGFHGKKTAFSIWSASFFWASAFS